MSEIGQQPGRLPVEEATTSIDRVLRQLVREELVQVVRAELPALLRASEANATSDLLSVDEAAQRLGVSSHTVYKRANSGKLASVKDGGRLLFRPEDLDAHVASCRRSAKATEKKNKAGNGGKGRVPRRRAGARSGRCERAQGAR